MFNNIFSSYIKMPKDSSHRYYQKRKTKKRLTRISWKYQNLSKEETEKKGQYECKQYKNLSENGKQKLVDYRKDTIKS